MTPLVVTRDEAAQLLGLTANAFDELAPAINWFELGGREVANVSDLQRVLDERARGAETMRTKALDAETELLARRGFKPMEYAHVNGERLFTKYGKTYDRREAIEAAEAGE
ncbi:MAG: hypothetical protein ACRDMH_02855 [Solirubrobacterales bacterium]